MTTSIQTPTARPTGPAPTKETIVAPETKGATWGWRWIWIPVATLLIFAGTFALAWYNANQLTRRFVTDADASFAAGKYLDALVGYQTFDEEHNQYVNHGGYLAVENVWSNRYSWPQPDAVASAQARSQEIIDQRLTIQEAEEYIQANIGKPAPYFAEIYLRLGELYAAEGSVADARDIYESIADLFANRPDLIERAQVSLTSLDSGNR